MVNRLVYLLATTLTLWSMAVSAQPVTTSLDRTEIMRGETVRLTIRVDGQQGGVQMDLSPLQENFELVSTRTSSQLRATNNRTESWIDYYLTLFPRNEGEIEIPSLSVAGEMTQPLRINVLPKNDTSIIGQDLYLETSINKDSIYVQEQLLFTIKLYFAMQGIRNPIFTEVNIPDTVIQPIGSANQYTTIIDGNDYGVYEIKYALFPQRSGEIKVPDIMFRGEVTDGSSNYVFRNLNTRTITAFAEGYTVEVKEKPANYPADAVWLPASEVTIEQEWDNDLTNVRIGDAVTRKVTVEAFGLDGAALPPLPRQSIESINFYPQPPEIERTYIDNVIVGARIEQSSLVSTETGTVRITGMSLPWFDIDTGEVKYATLQDTAIRVGPLRTSAPDDSVANTDSAGDIASDDLLSNNLDSNLVNGVQTPVWIIVLASALSAAILAYMYRRSQRTPTSKPEPTRAPSAAPMYDQDIAPNEEAKSYAALVTASKKLHLPALRLAIIAWGRQYFADANLHTLDEVATRTQDTQIKSACIKIQQALYGENSEDAATLKPEIEALVTRVQVLRTSRNQKLVQDSKEQDYVLPPLYKA